MTFWAGPLAAEGLELSQVLQAVWLDHCLCMLDASSGPFPVVTTNALFRHWQCPQQTKFFLIPLHLRTSVLICSERKSPRHGEKFQILKSCQLFLHKRMHKVLKYIRFLSLWQMNTDISRWQEEKFIEAPGSFLGGLFHCLQPAVRQKIAVEQSCSLHESLEVGRVREPKRKGPGPRYRA